MGEKPRIGRPRKNTQRVELRLNKDDSVIKALNQEARARGVNLQQHITDILVVRHLNRGVSLPEPSSPLPTTDNAAALADEWM